MEKVLEELTNLGSSGVSRAIEGYTTWYLVSAIGWFVVGIVIVICGYKLGKLKMDSDEYENADIWNALLRYIAAGIVLFIGIAIIIFHLSTICAPEAYAIHHFISDIKP